MKEEKKTDDGSGQTSKPGGIERAFASKPAAQGNPPGTSPSNLVFPRLLIGLIVLICAEVFSGASIQVGLWHPWTWMVTYWLYFTHFFFFTTLAVRTGRTSLWSLYLWGVLFGLYESWITKVIWYGYSGDGKLVMGSIGPYGFSEISMVFLFHPLASFIVPLVVACVLCPALRRLFPDLAWFTGKSKGAWVVRVYLVLSFVSVLGMNSGGPANLTMNLAVVLVLLLVLSPQTRTNARHRGPGGDAGIEACEDPARADPWLGSCIVGLCRNAGPVNPSRGELCDLDTSGVRADGGGPRKRGWGTHDSRTRSSGLKDNQECGSQRPDASCSCIRMFHRDRPKAQRLEPDSTPPPAAAAAGPYPQL